MVLSRIRGGVRQRFKAMAEGVRFFHTPHSGEASIVRPVIPRANRDGGAHWRLAADTEARSAGNGPTRRARGAVGNRPPSAAATPLVGGNCAPMRARAGMNLQFRLPMGIRRGIVRREKAFRKRAEFLTEGTSSALLETVAFDD